MFPLYPPISTLNPRPTSRPTTPSGSSSGAPGVTANSLPPTGPTLVHLYNTLLRPTLLPPPAAFTQPLLDSFVAHHDPLLEDTSIFTAASRMREVGVEVERVEREWRRRGQLQVQEEDKDVSLAQVREARLRCRLANQAAGSDRTRKERLKVRMDAFEEEMKREEEEALKAFKEGLRRAVGG